MNNLFNQQKSEFIGRHIGPNESEIAQMLQVIGTSSVEELISLTVPNSIRLKAPLQTGEPVSEYEYLKELKKIADKNKVCRTYIGKGYYNTITPSVILRNVFENPGWYTQYTPYQAEIAQGRLESLLNFQTMVSDLTGLPIANASLLDEGTAAAEAMAMLFNQKNKVQDQITAPKFFVDENIFQQTKEVLITRANPINVEIVLGDFRSVQLDESYFGAIVQYPNKNGSIEDHRNFINDAHSVNAQVIMATDLLALCLLTPPGELGADVAIGNTQRFGVPMGFGGPHAAFFATKDEYKRNIPGRIIGVTVDAKGNRCLRMALQTREQHIRREKATSNICTAQALLANMASLYSVYHRAEGLKKIANRTSLLTLTLSNELEKIGFKNNNQYFFDTIAVNVTDTNSLRALSEASDINFGYDNNLVTISLDETTTQNDIIDIIRIFSELNKNASVPETVVITENKLQNIPTSLNRTSSFLTHPVFNSHHSETQMMRYLKYYLMIANHH
jgi:glycine dehydrogenase